MDPARALSGSLRPDSGRSKPSALSSRSGRPFHASGFRGTWIGILVSFLVHTFVQATAGEPSDKVLNQRFETQVQPFLGTYCLSCHGHDKPKSGLDLSKLNSLAATREAAEVWKGVLERLEAGDMPPEKAKQQPDVTARQELIRWSRDFLRSESRRNAGDPGPVLARRLSHAEYDNSIRDLTGRDLHPTREFPDDPSNSAGFDNSGESLSMSPALVGKYLTAAREVADHMYLRPDRIAFAPHPMRAETDRDKFCVQQIIDFYHRYNTNLASYFEAAWQYRHRAALGQRGATLESIATLARLSPRYLTNVWNILTDRETPLGPVLALRTRWNALPPPGRSSAETLRAGFQGMRDYVSQVRHKVEPRFANMSAGNVDSGRQPLITWRNIQYATHRRTFDPAQLQVDGEPRREPAVYVEPGTSNPFGPGNTVLITNAPGDVDLKVPAGERARYEAAFARFCSVFPDMFYKEERGRNYFDATQDRGRYLSAGFHNMMGYFRDDQPLYEMILSPAEQRELDALWFDLHFVAAANARTFVQFFRAGSRGEGQLVQNEAGAVPERPEDRDPTSDFQINALEKRYLEQAKGGAEIAIRAIRDFFQNYRESLRGTERAHLAAEPVHLQALADFATRAFRRPLTADERAELLADYKTARERDGLDHESAIRDGIVGILMSPQFCYRLDLARLDSPVGPGFTRLSDYDLASRLSYFLWSAPPDAELLRHAAAGDLHQPKVLTAQTRRMLQDPRLRALAVEFGGNWLEFRRFESLSSVDRGRFPQFDNALRTAMFEEPARFLLDLIQSNRPVTDCLLATHTFVNPVLARHYGMPEMTGTNWVRVDRADQYGRGGILPMAAFLTKNAPGLRTSPVKRGNWVVRNVLGEHIPAPPPTVPELPRDESKMDLPLAQMLARHRADPNCASCHARFDSLGLVFEGYGPIGERRDADLAGHRVDPSAVFPGGMNGTGLTGLQAYLRARRQTEFVDTFCRKLLAFALNRSLILSDDLLVEDMTRALARDKFRVQTAIEHIVTSPQFLNLRNRNTVTSTESPR